MKSILVATTTNKDSLKTLLSKIVLKADWVLTEKNPCPEKKAQHGLIENKETEKKLEKAFLFENNHQETYCLIALIQTNPEEHDLLQEKTEEDLKIILLPHSKNLETALTATTFNEKNETLGQKLTETNLTDWSVFEGTKEKTDIPPTKIEIFKHGLNITTKISRENSPTLEVTIEVDNEKPHLLAFLPEISDEPVLSFQPDHEESELTIAQHGDKNPEETIKIETKTKKNTRFFLQYRDADNYKYRTTFILAGILTEEEKNKLSKISKNEEEISLDNTPYCVTDLIDVDGWNPNEKRDDNSISVEYEETTEETGNNPSIIPDDMSAKEFVRTILKNSPNAE